MHRLLSIAVVAFLAATTAITAQEDRESVTVIRRGPGGEVQILSKEQSSPAAETDTAARAAAREIEADTTPRKARVVVIPAVFAQENRRRIDRELNERFGLTDPGVIENPGYTSYLIDALVNVRKFDMLERDELRQVVRELDFGESDYVDLEKVVKIGNMVGADYIIIPTIRYLEVDREVKDVPYIGGQQVAIRSKLATNVRTVDVASGRIIASGVREVEKKNRQRQQDSERILVMDTISECYKESALLEAAQIVDVAYPIRIMSISGDTVMLNRGQGAILPGETLKIFATGEVMIDPDTGDSLGYHEAYVGSVKVTEVDLKTSKAAIVDRQGVIERLAICRRTEQPSLDDPRLKQGPSAAPRID
ncbi:MAG: CsgG/HfaB family protein [Kiritimatiellia bacterium]